MAYNGTGRFYVVGYDGSPSGDVDYETEGVAAEGIMPLYQRCVHLGCRVPYCGSSKWFECPCHGSKYNGAGEYKLGPAPRGMDRFQIDDRRRQRGRRHVRGDPRAASRHRHDRPAAAGPVLRGDRIEEGNDTITVMLAATSTAGIVLLVLGAIFVVAAGARALLPQPSA